MCSTAMYVYINMLKKVWKDKYQIDKSEEGVKS